MENESCFTSGADPFGAATLVRPWDDHSNSMENAKTRAKAAFEFMSKLGIRHYTYHDVYVNLSLHFLNVQSSFRLVRIVSRLFEGCVNV